MRYFIIICGIIFALRFHLPPPMPAQQTLMYGTIASIPTWHKNAWQFIFLPEHLKHQRILVSWYAPPPVQLRIGDEWELELRIKPANNNWLFAQQINGTASVQMNWHNQITLDHPWKYPIDHIRENLSNDLQHALKNNPGLGFISALSLGIRDRITENQWQDLRNTGTNHLMAIAGLHIGFVTAMAYALFNWLWRRSTRLMLRVPAQEAATFFSLFVAILYSALAGFALPTQRAIIMLSVFLFGRLMRRQIPLWHSWLIALGLVLVWEPLAVLTPSFWLSFSAVALLIFGLGGRLNMQGFWWHWGRAQWVMAIGLIPLSLLFFQQVSLISFIANFIAIPFIGFIILPLCISATFFDVFNFTLANFCWHFTATLLMGFWTLMHWLATLPHSQWQIHAFSPWLLIPSTIGVLLLLAPKGWPARWIGLLWLLPVVVAPH